MVPRSTTDSIERDSSTAASGALASARGCRARCLDISRRPWPARQQTPRARLRRRPENRREIPGRSADPARSHRRRNRSSADHRTADAPGARRAAVRRRIRYPRPHPCVGSARVRALHALGLRCDVRRVCVRRRGSAATVSIGVRRFESAHRAGKPSVHRIARLAGIRIVGCGPHRRVARGARRCGPPTAPPHARRIRSDVGRHRLVVPPATRAANAVMLLTIRCQQTPRTLRCRRAATRAWHNGFPAHQCTRSLQ